MENNAYFYIINKKINNGLQGKKRKTPFVGILLKIGRNFKLKILDFSRIFVYFNKTSI